MIYKVTDINYDIEFQDIEDEINEDEYETNSEFMQAVFDKMDEVLCSLPTELTLSIDECEDIEYQIADMISNETNWLVNSFQYKKVA